MFSGIARAIYYHGQLSKTVTIRRVRPLRNQILNESRREHPFSQALQGEGRLEIRQANPQPDRIGFHLAALANIP